MSSRADFRYLDGTDIRDALREVGFGDTAIRRVLEDLCEARFMFTSAHTEPSLASSFYPSRLGGLVIRFLIADPTFLEAVMMDTFVHSKLWVAMPPYGTGKDSLRAQTEKSTSAAFVGIHSAGSRLPPRMPIPPSPYRYA